MQALFGCRDHSLDFISFGAQHHIHLFALGDIFK